MATFDQTSQDWLADSQPGDLGTGMVLQILDQGGAQALAVILVEDVTYEECLAEADGHAAFKWIPHSVADSDELRNTPCGGRCVETCVMPGCICDSSGVCRKATN